MMQKEQTLKEVSDWKFFCFIVLVINLFWENFYSLYEFLDVKIIVWLQILGERNSSKAISKVDLF